MTAIGRRFPGPWEGFALPRMEQTRPVRTSQPGATFSQLHAELKQRMEKRDVELTRTKAALAESQRLVATLTDRLADSCTTSLKAELAQVTSELAELKRQAEKWNSELDAWKVGKGTSDCLAASLQKEVQTLRSEPRKKESLLEKSHIPELKRQSEEKHREIQKVMSELAELKHQAEKRNAELDMWKAGKGLSDYLAASLQKEVQTLRSELHKKESVLEGSNIPELKRQSQEKDREIQKVTSELAQLKHQAEKWNSEINAWKFARGTSDCLAASLQKELQTLRSELCKEESLLEKSNFPELKRQSEEKDPELQKVESDLAELKHQAEKWNAELDTWKAAKGLSDCLVDSLQKELQTLRSELHKKESLLEKSNIPKLKRQSEEKDREIQSRIRRFYV